jgi:hypothetical protein
MQQFASLPDFTKSHSSSPAVILLVERMKAANAVMERFPKVTNSLMNGFLKVTTNSIKKSITNSLSSGFRKPVHMVATNGFRKPYQDQGVVGKNSRKLKNVFVREVFIRVTLLTK